jgi:hypothetical protein
LFPRKVFENHLKEFGYFGVIMAVMVIPFFTSEVEDAPDMDELAENMKKLSQSIEVDDSAFTITSKKTYDKYFERLMGVFEDMYKFNYV